ncbi:Inner membrane protein YiaA [Pseudoalteromonas sp. P1-9]|uniref:inner membrane protein YiaA n=1 Tax=Pseudoalteromonas sp. P1-9 TaxID=1710354 RepID=UPI0006D5F609|nr:inner membrane protein YiaA [Pseudoalteromonas sp. P1-9]KPV96958.1 Inner membrane protein YiaA [Pseudoalteromonas sp. P1-9]
MDNLKPTSAFKLSAIASLVIGMGAYLIGLYNATLLLNEKGYYLIILLYSLFAAVSLQKVVRDKQQGLPISKPYTMICWISLAIAIALLAIGLFNADMLLSEKGFFAMAYTLSLFSAITVQKNIRDMLAFK